MENFIIYMAKACGLIALFFLAYQTLLKKETFFNSNRWFLLAGLFTAVALPLLVYTKTVWIVPDPVSETLTRTVTMEQLVLYKQYQQQLTDFATAEAATSINWFDVIAGIYFAGVLLFSIRFIHDFVAIRRILSWAIAIKDGRFRLIDSEKAQSPFSFFSYIVYNSATLKQEELSSIILHEKVHSSQQHSLDMIVSQLFCIVFWFNPFVWMYKKAISQNLEFIADAEAIKLMEDKKAYQKTLLKITVQPDCISLTNHFYQSLIKKRIVMLNKQQSKKWNSWKYITVLPLLAAFTFFFQVKTVAQAKQAPIELIKLPTTNVKFSVEINKDLQDSELEESKKLIKEECNADVNYENVTRNLNKEITGIKVTVKYIGQSQIYEVSGNQPISTFTIEVEKNNSGRNQISFGTGDSDIFVRANAFHISGNDMDINSLKSNDSVPMLKGKINRSYGLNENIMPPMPPQTPEGHWSVNSLKIGDTDMLIVINGVKQKKGSDAIKLPLGQEIAEMNMLKAKEAKKKYGKDAKDGAVEIITKQSNDIGFEIGPEVFSFEMMPQDFNFNFDMPDFNIEDIQSIRNLGDLFQKGNVEIWGNLTEEEMKRIQEDVEKAQAEIKRLSPEINEKLRMKEMTEDEHKAAKQEIEKAKKEIEESRKELEKSRKELEKTRKQLNKKA